MDLKEIVLWIGALSGFISLVFQVIRTFSKSKLSVSFNQLHILPIPEYQVETIVSLQIMKDAKRGIQAVIDPRKEKFIRSLNLGDPKYSPEDKIKTRIKQSFEIHKTHHRDNPFLYPNFKLLQLYPLSDSELKEISQSINVVFLITIPITVANDGYFGKIIDDIVLIVSSDKNNMETLFRARSIINEGDFSKLLTKKCTISELDLVTFYPVAMQPNTQRTLFAVFEFNYSTPEKDFFPIQSNSEYSWHLKLKDVSNNVLNQSCVRSIEINDLLPIWNETIISIPLM